MSNTLMLQLFKHAIFILQSSLIVLVYLTIKMSGQKLVGRIRILTNIQQWTLNINFSSCTISQIRCNIMISLSKK